MSFSAILSGYLLYWLAPIVFSTAFVFCYGGILFKNTATGVARIIIVYYFLFCGNLALFILGWDWGDGSLQQISFFCSLSSYSSFDNK